jgi:hypothetical protein
MSVLFSCSAPRAPARAAALPAPPLASAVVVPTRPPLARATEPAAPAVPLSRDVFGYLGKRGIIGAITADGSHWTGSFHFVGGGQEVKLDGTATEPERDPDAPEEQPALDGRKLHSYLNCRFTANGQPGAIDDASCLDEPHALEIDGTWSSGKTSEPFFLRTAGDDASSSSVGYDRYYAAVLAAPTSPHECPPFIEMLSVHEREGRDTRATISYRMRWPCEHQSAEERYSGALGASATSSAPSFEAYVADFTGAEPHQRLWSEQWTTLADPDDPNEVSLRFEVLELAPGLELYAGSMNDDFQSPFTSGGNSSQQLTVWAVSVTGRYGAKLVLPAAESGHGGWCISSSQSNEIWLLDLDGDKVPEIVMRVTESGHSDGIGKDGNPECVETPTTVKLAAFRLNRNTLTWAPLPAPKGLSEQRLKHGTPIQL